MFPFPHDEILKLGLYAYAAGFVLWNVFLGRFGFFEFNLLETRFLSAGIAFILPIILFQRLYKVIEIQQSKILNFILFLVYFFSALYFFARIPQWLGGARPEPISLIGSASQMKDLQDYNITLVTNASGRDSVQTELLCKIYQNGEFILFGIINRVPEETTTKVEIRNGIIILKLDRIGGLHTVLPGELKNARDYVCGPFRPFGVW